MSRYARLITVALLLLGIGWSVSPRSALPLYDGIGFPDEPYRFVERPPGAQETDPPTTARGTATVSGGTVEPLVAASDEVAAQVAVFIPKRRLDAPQGTTKVTVTAAPVQSVAAGRDQYLWSNVYDVEVSPAGTRFNHGGQQATITLRAASTQRPQPHIAYYRDGHWQLLPTFAQGQDIYIAELTGFGKFAVIGSNPLLVTRVSSGGKSGGGGGTAIGLVVGFGVALVIVVLFVLGRMRRARARAAGADGGDGDVDVDEAEGAT